MHIEPNIFPLFSKKKGSHRGCFGLLKCSESLNKTHMQELQKCKNHNKSPNGNESFDYQNISYAIKPMFHGDFLILD